jgi:hypothetical protein
MTAEAFFGGLVNGFTAPARMIGIPIPTIGGGGGGGAQQMPPAMPPPHVQEQSNAELQQILIAGFAGLALLLLFK